MSTASMDVRVVPLQYDNQQAAMQLQKGICWSPKRPLSPRVSEPRP
jgi:hypothetical protein